MLRDNLTESVMADAELTQGRIEVSDEDAKLVTLARSSRARTGAVEGAAVRDETGRTYAATTVALSSLNLTAIQAAVAAAVASGAKALEGAAVSTQVDAIGDDDLAILRELAVAGAVVARAGVDGQVQEIVAL